MSADDAPLLAARGKKGAPTPTIRSPAAVFLAYAMRNLDLAEAAKRERPLAQARWRAVEHRLSCFVFACSALEAHAVAVHQAFFAHRMPSRAVLAWRERPLAERLFELLPRRERSLRREQLLEDVLTFRRRVEQPPPFPVAEQIELFARPEPERADAFWFGDARSAFVRLFSEPSDEHRPADLPGHPLDLDERGLETALLVVLEHIVLLDRHFKGWAEWPLRAVKDGRPQSAAAWFEELRGRYEGPHAAYFRRIRIER